MVKPHPAKPEKLLMVKLATNSHAINEAFYSININCIA